MNNWKEPMEFDKPCFYNTPEWDCWKSMPDSLRKCKGKCCSYIPREEEDGRVRSTSEGCN